MTELVWYAAYGSNLRADRLGYYLAGGNPPGSYRTYPGCRDPSPPRRTVPVHLPGGIYFAGESGAWTGGMAFYDAELAGTVAARAYLLTVDQFADVVTQEMYRTPPGVTPDDVRAAVGRGRVTLGPGRYETLVCPARFEEHPLLTFTAPGRASDAVWNRPVAAYLRMLAGGLRESHGWDADRVTAYLADRPGVAGTWPRAELAVVVETACAAYEAAGPPAP